MREAYQAKDQLTDEERARGALTRGQVPWSLFLFYPILTYLILFYPALSYLKLPELV